MSYTLFIIIIRSDSSDVVGLMKQHLPEYIVNCFIVAGFDSVDAICAMDDNTVSVIEEFIDKRKECYPSCIRPGTCQTSLPFEFPPGHKIRIATFIALMQRQFQPCTQIASKVALPPPSKKGKFVTESESISEDIPSVTSAIRTKILSWTREHENGKFAEAKEGDDFTINVTRSTTIPAKFNASITCCKCNISIMVTKKPSGERVICNWSRHFKNCDHNQKSKKRRISNQSILKGFFEPKAACSTSIAVGTSTFDNRQKQPKHILQHSLSQQLNISPIKEIPIIAESSSEESDDESLSKLMVPSQINTPSQDTQAFAQLLHVPDFPSVQLPQNRAQNPSQPSSIPHSLQTNSLNPVVETMEEVFQ